jgi:hypothetical protein
MLRVSICNSWHTLDCQSVILVPQSTDVFECAGIIKFAKFPMHQGVAIKFAAIWEFEVQTSDFVTTK